MSLNEAKCDKCGYEEKFPHILRSYLLDSGQKLGVEQTFAWCENCNKIVWAERIPDLDQIEAELKQSSEFFDQSKSHDLLEANKFPSYLESEELRIEWRQTRKAPPKCLECGSIK